MTTLLVPELDISIVFCSAIEIYNLTSNSVFNFPLHLEGVHIYGPVSNDSCTCNASVWLTETIFMVIFSAKDRLGWYKSTSRTVYRN